MNEVPWAAARFRALLESVPDAVIGIDPAGLIAMVNARVERLSGYRRDELLGRPVELLVVDRAGQPVRPAWYLDAGAREAGLNLAARRRNGTRFPVEVCLSTVGTDDGPLICAAIRDATERAQVEHALRAQREQTDAIITTASDPFVSIDADGRIIEWNRSAEKLFGWSKQELIGSDLAETIIPERYRQAHRDGLRRIVSGGDPRVLDRRVELAAIHRDGHEVPVELTPWRVTSGGVDCFHAFLHDITERLQLQVERERHTAQTEREEYERRQQHSQRLESLGQLAGGVAHDFNNLLAVIANYADFVAANIAPALAEDHLRWHETADDVAQIQRAAERAARLTRQLLTFGRRDVVRPEVLNLNQIVEEIEQLLKRTLGEQITLVTTPAADLSPVFADPGQIEQILVNLAVNARDAMPSGGTLTIDTANSTLDESYAAAHPGLHPGQYVRLRISDTGTGMTPEVMQRAFEPFYTSKPKGSGTGLGLATVYGIVTHAGGQVRLDSQPGLGTTVSVLLPATERVAVAPSPALTAPPPAGGWHTVLLVEDDEAIREVARRILVRNGYHVLASTDPTAAIELARTHADDIHLLLTDVVMPDMLGKEVAAAILAIRPAIRVLYMSGYAQPVLASQGTLEPGVILIEKPFSAEILLERVNHVLAGECRAGQPEAPWRPSSAATGSR